MKKKEANCRKVFKKFLNNLIILMHQIIFNITLFYLLYNF